MGNVGTRSLILLTLWGGLWSNSVTMRTKPDSKELTSVKPSKTPPKTSSNGDVPPAHRLYQRNHALNHPTHVRARQIVQYAIRKGKLIRPTTCFLCSVVCVPHAHHNDYDKPLDVRWLCRPCHRRAHGHTPYPKSSANIADLVRSLRS